MALRILHLLERQADAEAQRSVEQLCRGLGEEFESSILTLGESAPSAALRAIQSLRAMRPRPDLLHAWGSTALTAAALAWTGPIFHTPAADLTSRALRWLRAVMAYRDIRLVCPTATQLHLCLKRGLPPHRCVLIRPGVDFSRLRRRRDDALRRRLRLEPDDFVLLACGESVRAASHLEAIWAAGILHVLDRRYKILLWGRGVQTSSLRRRGKHMGAADALRFADDCLGGVEFEQLLSAADLVLVPARGQVRTLDIATCMGAGLPIVATASPVVSELLEDRHTALMTRTAHPRLIVRRVLEFRENPALQWQLADRAKAEAYDFFSQSRFLEEYRKLYPQPTSPGESPPPAQSVDPRLQTAVQ